jgi:hypothetical protein
MRLSPPELHPGETIRVALGGLQEPESLIKPRVQGHRNTWTKIKATAKLAQ